MAWMVCSKSLSLTPTMMESSLEPWSIIRTLILARLMALKSLAAVPQLCTMPRPTVAMMDRLSLTDTLPLPSTSFSMAAMIRARCGSNMELCTTRHMLSIPVGICSKETPSSSRTESTRRAKPTSLFIMFFSMLITL